MVSAATAKEMVRASYIWIKHEEERREASWKEPEGRVFSATTRTDVAALLGEPRDQILAGRASFADLSAQHSGCWGLKRTPVHALGGSHYAQEVFDKMQSQRKTSDEIQFVPGDFSSATNGYLEPSTRPPADTTLGSGEYTGPPTAA